MISSAACARGRASGFQTRSSSPWADTRGTQCILNDSEEDHIAPPKGRHGLLREHLCKRVALVRAGVLYFGHFLGAPREG